MLPPKVVQQSYGKSQVRLSRVHRDADQHRFIELVISISLDGDFVASYSAADNSKVIATDSMKNTVYVLASRHGVASMESFAQLLCRHFLETYSHITHAEIHCEERLWKRMVFDGKPHAFAFVGGTSERNTCTVHGLGSAGSDPSIRMNCGFAGLQVLKTTESGFASFLRDQYTTLPETNDRIFATTITASWNCVDETGRNLDLTSDWTDYRQKIRDAVLDVFANKYSESVQHTLYEMGRAAFGVCPLIGAIEITMPNQHHLLANLAPFGLENPNQVFVPTSEPFGNISATIQRDGREKAP